MEGSRPRCFFDVMIGGLPCGRIVFELFTETVPKTCDNFISLCAGDKGLGKNTQKPLNYGGVIFHRVVKDFIIQAGDFSNGNGTGGESIYGGTFEDENFAFKHDQPFLLSMANRGKNTNGSQFFITTQPAPHLDNIHVIFGRVVGGADVVRQIENLSVDANSRPLQDARIAKCGELVRQVKVVKKKKPVASSNEENASEEEERFSSRKKHKKEKKRSKKEKKAEKSRTKVAEPEEGEIHDDLHPLASVSNINPDDIPDVPVNRFLLRSDSRNFNNRNNRFGDHDGGGFNRYGNNRNDNWSYNNRRENRESRKSQTTKSGRTIKGRGVFRYRTPSRSRSRSRSATPVHWRKEEARVIKLSVYEKQDGLVVRPPNTVASTVAVVAGLEDVKDEQKRDGSVEKEKKREDEKIDYNALDYEEEHQDMRHHLQEKRRQQNLPKLVQYPLPGDYEEDVTSRDLYSPLNENSQVMLSNKRSEVLAMALGVQVKTGEDPPIGDIHMSSFDRDRKGRTQMGQMQHHYGGGGGGYGGYGGGGQRQMSPGMEVALATGNKAVKSSVNRGAGKPGREQALSQSIKERERLLHQRLLEMAGGGGIIPSMDADTTAAHSHSHSHKRRSRSRERSDRPPRHTPPPPGTSSAIASSRAERDPPAAAAAAAAAAAVPSRRERDRERSRSPRERQQCRSGGGGGSRHRSGQVRRHSRTHSRSRTPPLSSSSRSRRHSGGDNNNKRNGTTQKTHTPSPDKEKESSRINRKAEQILLLKQKMEVELREQLRQKKKKQEADKEKQQQQQQQRILLEKQLKAKEEAVMLDKAKRAQRDAAQKEKLLKTVKALQELDKSTLGASSSNSKEPTYSSSSGKKAAVRSKRSPSTSSSSSSSSTSSSSSSTSESSRDRKKRRARDDKKMSAKTEKSRHR